MIENYLTMEGITKTYPNGIVANKNVNFYVRKGEIHALAGENGAGKSTLMKILFGQESMDKGVISLNGEGVDITSSHNAIERGIGMVHQHFMLVPSMTVAENLVLGMEPKKNRLFDMKEAVRLTEEVSKKYNLYVNPLAIVKDLSVGLKQRVEILKTLLRGAEILILDEPTAVLTPQETTEIFKELVKLKEMGHTIIFISHKLKEIKELCDRITIMRDGELIGVYDVDTISEKEISSLMVGREIQSNTAKTPTHLTEERIRVENLDVYDNFGTKLLEKIDFKVRAGEILGVAGIEGNGQNELSELLTGISKPDKNKIWMNNMDVSNLSIRKIREAGQSHISQDRMTYGTVSDSSIHENIIGDRYYKQTGRSSPFIDEKRLNSETDQLIEDYDIVCDSRYQQVGMLSGGNMQKVVVAREFSSNPNIVIANQPTRGIDVGAAEFVRNKLISLRNDGASILLISADLTEIIDLSDRIIVLHDGKISAYLDIRDDKITPEEIGEYMLGIKTKLKNGESEIEHIKEY